MVDRHNEREQEQRLLDVVRVYTGEDGESHFEDAPIGLENRGLGGRISALIRGSGVMFREVDITVGDGTVRRLGPGEILLAEDTTGRGHKSTAVDGQPRTCLFIPVDDDADI